jgi:hypothetical protein
MFGLGFAWGGDIPPGPMQTGRHDAIRLLIFYYEMNNHDNQKH